MSLIAVFVALGGTSYVAVKIPRNSVGASQIKANGVGSSEVKNGALVQDDFKAGQLPAGAKGDTGTNGTNGTDGVVGPVTVQRTDDTVADATFKALERPVPARQIALGGSREIIGETPRERSRRASGNRVRS